MNPRNFLAITPNAHSFGVVRSKGIKVFLEVVQMVIFLLAFYQNVLHVELNVSPNLMYEHLVHQPLIHSAHILESEWHYFVAKETLTGDE